jgi:hypothetical protein
MTVTDHPNKSGGLGEGGFGPRRRPPGTRGAVAKVDADVADLLGVSALNPSALPAAPAPDEGAANDLLDTLVQDHLERATGPVFPAAPEAGGGDRADLLQKEIEALLAGDPLDDAPRESGAVQAAAEPAPLAAADADMMALEEVAGMEILRPGREPSLSDAELSVLLPGEVSETGAEAEAVAGAGGAVEAEPLEAPSGGASAAEEVARELLADASMSAAGPSAEAPALPMDESEESIAAAEGALADELAALERESMAAAAANAAPAAEAPIAEVPAGTTDEIAAGVEQALAAVAVREEPPVAARTAPPVVILQPDEPEEEEAAPGIWKRAWRSVSDMALMVAQLVDLPFSWISGLDKHILGVAAVVFFFSGLLLVVLGWWLGAR